MPRRSSFRMSIATPSAWGGQEEPAVHADAALARRHADQRRSRSDSLARGRSLPAAATPLRLTRSWPRENRDSPCQAKRLTCSPGSWAAAPALAAGDRPDRCGRPFRRLVAGGNARTWPANHLKAALPRRRGWVPARSLSTPRTCRKPVGVAGQPLGVAQLPQRPQVVGIEAVVVVADEHDLALGVVQPV